MARFGADAYYVGYEGLINGIIKQAMLDWAEAMYKLRKDPQNILALRAKSDVERFFQSEWYSFMCGVDGGKLMQLIETAFNNGELELNRKI